MERASTGLQQQRERPGGTERHPHVQWTSGQSGNVDERESKADNWRTKL